MWTVTVKMCLLVALVLLITRGSVLHGHWVGFPTDDGRALAEILSLDSLPHWGQYAGILIFYNVPAQQFVLGFNIMMKQFILTASLVSWMKKRKSKVNQRLNLVVETSSSSTSSNVPEFLQ